MQRTCYDKSLMAGWQTLSKRSPTQLHFDRAQDIKLMHSVTQVILDTQQKCDRLSLVIPESPCLHAQDSSLLIVQLTLESMLPLARVKIAACVTAGSAETHTFKQSDRVALEAG